MIKKGVVALALLNSNGSCVDLPKAQLLQKCLEEIDLEPKCGRRRDKTDADG